MTHATFEFLCPKCAARGGWSPGEDTRMVCRNCRHELEVQTHGGGRYGVKVIGEPAPRENRSVTAPDPLLVKVKRFALWHRTFQGLSGLSLLVMVLYLMWNRYARHSAADKWAYSEAAREEYTSLGWDKVKIVFSCIALSALFGLIAAQIKHYAEIAIEESGESLDRG